MSGTSQEQNKAFRTALVDVGKALIERDVKELAFEFGIKRADADRLRNGWELFDLMLKQTFIEATNVDPLIDLLDKRDLNDCSRILKSYKKQFDKVPVPVPVPVPGPGPGPVPINRVMGKVVTRETLRDLAGQLMDKWKDVGRELKITDSDIYNLKTDHSPQREINFQMLLLWKQQNGNLATHDVLANALSSAKRQDLADLIIGDIGPTT